MCLEACLIAYTSKMTIYCRKHGNVLIFSLQSHLISDILESYGHFAWAEILPPWSFLVELAKYIPLYPTPARLDTFQSQRKLWSRYPFSQDWKKSAFYVVWHAIKACRARCIQLRAFWSFLLLGVESFLSTPKLS